LLEEEEEVEKPDDMEGHEHFFLIRLAQRISVQLASLDTRGGHGGQQSVQPVCVVAEGLRVPPTNAMPAAAAVVVVAGCPRWNLLVGGWRRRQLQ